MYIFQQNEPMAVVPVRVRVENDAVGCCAASAVVENTCKNENSLLVIFHVPSVQ